VWHTTDLRFVCLVTVGIIETFIEMVINSRLFIAVDILILQSGWGKALDVKSLHKRGTNSMCTSYKKMWDVTMCLAWVKGMVQYFKFQHPLNYVSTYLCTEK